jgi:hypothetical protein
MALQYSCKFKVDRYNHLPPESKKCGPMMLT